MQLGLEDAAVGFGGVGPAVAETGEQHGLAGQAADEEERHGDGGSESREGSADVGAEKGGVDEDGEASGEGRESEAGQSLESRPRGVRGVDVDP